MELTDKNIRWLLRFCLPLGHNESAHNYIFPIKKIHYPITQFTILNKSFKVLTRLDLDGGWRQMWGGAGWEGGVHSRGGAEGVRVWGEHGGREGAVRGQRLVRVVVLVMTQTRVRVKPEVSEAAEAERGVTEAWAEHVHGLRQNWVEKLDMLL